jgi:hypothetical protein
MEGAGVGVTAGAGLEGAAISAAAGEQEGDLPNPPNSGHEKLLSTEQQKKKKLSLNLPMIYSLRFKI